MVAVCTLGYSNSAGPGLWTKTSAKRNIKNGQMFLVIFYNINGIAFAERAEHVCDGEMRIYTLKNIHPPPFFYSIFL